jgi:hypothetical protein
VSLLSRLFGGSHTKYDSFIVQWAERKKEELRCSNQITPENMFAGFIYGLSSFSKSIEQFKSRKDIESSVPFSLAGFANDSALFELGCYHYFQVDMWLFAHCPDLRQWVSQIFIREFICLFTQALQITNVEELFRQRVEKYGEIARRGGNTEEYHRCLSQLILRTKDNQRPKPCDLDNESFQLVFEDMLLKMAIANWETGMVPAMIESMEATTKILKRSS